MRGIYVPVTSPHLFFSPACVKQSVFPKTKSAMFRMAPVWQDRGDWSDAHLGGEYRGRADVMVETNR